MAKRVTLPLSVFVLLLGVLTPFVTSARTLRKTASTVDKDSKKAVSASKKLEDDYTEEVDESYERTGSLDHSELLSGLGTSLPAASTEVQPKSREEIRLRHKFTEFDLDSSGLLDRMEITTALRDLGLSVQQIKILLEEAMADKQEVDFQAFRTMVLSARVQPDADQVEEVPANTDNAKETPEIEEMDSKQVQSKGEDEDEEVILDEDGQNSLHLGHFIGSKLKKTAHGTTRFVGGIVKGGRQAKKYEHASDFKVEDGTRAERAGQTVGKVAVKHSKMVVKGGKAVGKGAKVLAKGIWNGIKNQRRFEEDGIKQHKIDEEV